MINYEDFIKEVCGKLSEKRISALEKAANDLILFGKSEGKIFLQILKMVYFPFSNYFGKDGNQVYFEFK